MDISMDILGKSMDMDGKFHIHGKPELKLTKICKTLHVHNVSHLSVVVGLHICSRTSFRLLLTCPLETNSPGLSRRRRWGVSYPKPCNVRGAPPSPKKMKYTRMRHFKIKVKKKISTEAPQKCFSHFFTTYQISRKIDQYSISIVQSGQHQGDH